MKKIISLLLALTLCLGMLAGIAMAAEIEKPMEVSQADAGVKVTHTGDSSAAYYFETLTPELIKWACLNLEGHRTVTVLKDLSLSNDGVTVATFLEIPKENRTWYGGKNPGSQLIDFDLGGHTITYTGNSALLRTNRFGFKVSNGTILHYGTEKVRPVFMIGGTSVGTADTSGKVVYKPKVVLEDLNVFNLTEQGAAIVGNYLYGTEVTIRDSILFASGFGFTQYKSTQKDLAELKNYTIYEGEFAPTITLEDTVLLAGSGVASCSEETAMLNLSNTVLATPDKAIFPAKMKMTIDTKGQETTDVADYTFNYGPVTATAKAQIIGEDPTKVELPFTDVKEGDWFFSFVSEMYGKKIIAGQTATTFNPNGNLTYGAALKLLTVGVNGKDVGNATSGHWATNYLNEATAAGWTTIGADKLDAPVTREAFCEIAAKAKGLTEKAANPFKDTNNDAVLALVKAGVISGMSADTFNPAGVLTRAQIAKIISLLIKL